MAFSMEISDAEVIKNEVEEQIKPAKKEVEQLQILAGNNVTEILELDVNELEERRTFVKSIEEFGLETMKQSTSKNELLETSVGKLSKSGDEGSLVADSLVKLNNEIKELDPSGIDFTKKGFLGKVFNPIRSYFDKYDKADAIITDIVQSLDKGKETLKNDNTTLEIEELAMRDLTKKLMKEIEMGNAMDESLTKELEKAKVNNEDPDKIRFISEEIQFPLRQRIMDMQQVLVINQQGIIAVEVVRRNNNELIRGVDRAKNVTISAMRIAAMVAGALYNQKIVLKKLELINETTNNLISGTAKMLKDQGTQIHKQSIESNLSVDTLKGAFEDVMSAMDEISSFKQEALPQMKQTINEFRELATVGEKQIQRIEKGNLITEKQS